MAKFITDWGIEMKKKLLIIVILLLAAVAVSVWFTLTPKQDLPDYLRQFKVEHQRANNPIDNNQPTGSSIIYHTADFSENIYDDDVYLELIGPYVMRYKRGDIEVSLTEKEVESHSDWALFFYDYIETIKNGDHITYNSYFFDGYYNTHQKKNEFTMQKIYDLAIEELDINVQLDEEEYAWVTKKNLEPVFFNVKYKIRENNGTFRLGISSDTYQSQMYILATDKKDNIKIIDIVSLTPTY